MKYILIVPDGMADEPLEDLGGATPLQAARTPYIDGLARDGTVGMVQVTPPEMYPGSDAANMALLGYDPLQYYTGRGPIEAAAMGIPMEVRDVAFRCSLISTDGEKLLDYSAGHVTTADARVLMELVSGKLGTRKRSFYPGVSYRHIMVWHDGPLDLATAVPHENVGRDLAGMLPTGDGESELRGLIYDSLELLDDHPYNRVRRDQGKPVANMVWPWGQGRTPSLPAFLKLRGKSGAVISAVDVVRGLGELTGLDVINVAGATGYFDTDYMAKGRAAFDALHAHDFVWVHVEAPDEAGHAGSVDEKIKAIECIDSMVVGTLLDRLAREYDFRMLVVPDHATPISTRAHKICPVPYMLYDSKAVRHNVIPYDERAAEERVPTVEQGFRLIDQLLR